MNAPTLNAPARPGDTAGPAGPAGSDDPPRRTRLWLVVGSVLLVPTLIWSVYNVVLLVAHDEQTITETVAAEGVTTVEVNNPTGRVEIVGADVDQISIRAEVSHGLRRTGHGSRLDGDRLVVWGTCPIIGSTWCDVDYRIEVPRGMAIDVGSATRVELRGLSGPVEAEVDNGSISAVGLSGPTVLHSTNEDVSVEGHRGEELVASTTNGNVDVSLETPPKTVEVRSTNGDVVVALPPDEELRYRVSVESSNGDRINEVITDPNAERSVTARTSNGDATVRYR